MFFLSQTNMLISTKIYQKSYFQIDSSSVEFVDLLMLFVCNKQLIKKKKEQIQQKSSIVSLCIHFISIRQPAQSLRISKACYILFGNVNDQKSYIHKLNIECIHHFIYFTLINNHIYVSDVFGMKSYCCFSSHFVARKYIKC